MELRLLGISSSILHERKWVHRMVKLLCQWLEDCQVVRAGFNVRFAGFLNSKLFASIIFPCTTTNGYQLLNSIYVKHIKLYILYTYLSIYLKSFVSLHIQYTYILIVQHLCFLQKRFSIPKTKGKLGSKRLRNFPMVK